MSDGPMGDLVATALDMERLHAEMGTLMKTAGASSTCGCRYEIRVTAAGRQVLQRFCRRHAA